MTKHATKDVCPICEVTFLQHVHCGHASCTFLVTTCQKCDKEQAVRAFVSDHEADCDKSVTEPFVRQMVA